jgi:2-dehydropantoate 2-reductase
VQAIIYGERDGAPSARTDAIARTFAPAPFNARLTPTIMLEMWEKWVLIASLAGVTCLMRATIGDIIAAGGVDLALALHAECVAIATRAGFPPSASALARIHAMLTQPGSAMTASMLRDLESGQKIEGEQIIGDLLRRGGDAAAYPLLSLVNTQLKAYESRRSRGGL